MTGPNLVVLLYNVCNYSGRRVSPVRGGRPYRSIIMTLGIVCPHIFVDMIILSEPFLVPSLFPPTADDLTEKFMCEVLGMEPKKYIYENTKY